MVGTQSCHEFHSRFKREHVDTELSSSTHLTILRRKLTERRPKRGNAARADRFAYPAIHQANFLAILRARERKNPCREIQRTDTLLSWSFPSSFSIPPERRFSPEKCSSYKCRSIRTRRCPRRMSGPSDDSYLSIISKISIIQQLLYITVIRLLFLFITS